MGEQIFDWLFLEDVDFEGMLRSVDDINCLFENAVKHIPSAKGEHGDRYLHKLIVRILLAYRAAGGKAFTSQDAAPPFVERLMRYITELARSEIGDDHAAELEHRNKGKQLTCVIRKAMLRKSLWE